MKILNALTSILLLIILMSCNHPNQRYYDIMDIDTKWRNGELTEAKADVKKYLDKNPNNEIAWTLLGNIESDFEKDSLAVLAYDKALEINPETVEAITGKGIIYRKKGDYDKAAKCYLKAIELDPNYAEAYSSLVVINLKRKQFTQAVKVGLKGYELNSTDGVIASNLSVAYHYARDTIKREKFFNIAKYNGYKNLETLRDIFDGKLTILD